MSDLTKKSIGNQLELLLQKYVQIITTDGRVFAGLDQTLNAILTECEERIYSMENGIVKYELGLYLIRGDTIAIIGEIDEDIEANLNFPAIKANPLKPIVN